MSQIEIRSDFIRIARAFTAGVSGIFGEAYYKDLNDTACFGIYVEPHSCGQGVQIVSSDRCALCVQWDPKGYVDRARLIRGIDRSMALEMSGAVLDDRWLVGTPDKLQLRRDDGPRIRSKPLAGVSAHAVRLAHENLQEPGMFAYPNWRHLVPTADELAKMEDGHPGHFDMGYAAILSRLYSDGTQNCRTVRMKHTGGENPKAILQFPWRPKMFVVIAPQVNVSSEQWTDNFLQAMDGDEPSDKPAEDDDDPAAGL